MKQTFSTLVLKKKRYKPIESLELILTVIHEHLKMHPLSSNESMSYHNLSPE